MDIPLKRYVSLLSAYLRPQRRRVVLLAILLLGSIALQLLIPQILRAFIDVVADARHLESLPLRIAGTSDAWHLTGMALLFIGVAIAQQIISVGATYTSESVGWTATNALRADLAAHCMRLDMPFHNARTPGEMIERIDGDVSALANFFSQFVIQVFGNLIMIIGVLALLFALDARVGFALLLFVVVLLFALWRMRRITVRLWTAERQAFAEYYGFLEERLAGTEDIRSSGARGYVMKRFHDLLRAAFKTVLKSSFGFNIALNLSWVLFAVGTAIALALGAWLYGAGVLTIGAVYLVFQYTQYLQQPVERITRQIEDLQQATASIGRIEELLALQPMLKDGAQRDMPAGPLAVEFDRVSFGYGDEPILKGVSFRLEPGTALGLLGRTGSGKTTLARLLFRLYDVTSGAIRIGAPTPPAIPVLHDPSARFGPQNRDRGTIHGTWSGIGDDSRLPTSDFSGSRENHVDIRDLPLDVLRSHIGMVTQDVQLFHATVRDNLTFFDRSISDERILSVIEDLGLWGWYAALLNGLDTELQSGNAGLSSGEAQLLAFTRVFLRNPGLVILDEATSRLDRATERLIERAMDKLLRDRTRTAIIIAHRLTTVMQADDIMILEDGEVIERGDRERLANDPQSRFYQLLQTGMEMALA